MAGPYFSDPSVTASVPLLADSACSGKGSIRLLRNAGDGSLKAIGQSFPRPKRIILADLEATKAIFSDEIKRDEHRVKWELAKTIFGHYLGHDWVTTYFSPDRKNPKLEDYFRLDFSLSLESQQQKFARIMDFCETLVNLQHIDGFDERCDLVRAGQIEATVAELEFGRFLYMHDIQFRFVTPSGKKGEDYDCAITYQDGVVACADAKCRMESSAIDPKMIKHALEKARKQNLPKDKPGVVFVKVPQTWLESAETRRGIAETAREWLQGTERVVLVVLYCYVNFFHKKIQMTVLRHLVEEIQIKNIGLMSTRIGSFLNITLFRKSGRECHQNGIGFFRLANCHEIKAG